MILNYYLIKMSCTSPWDWSLDSRTNQELVTAADWAKSMIPQPSISASQWALVSKQDQDMQNFVAERGEGYAATTKIRQDQLKKKFESFRFLEKETLNDITNRYYHLMCEMRAFGVPTSQQEMVARFADALPPKWGSFIEQLKHTGTLNTVNIYEFIEKLEHKNDQEIWKAKRALVPQNTEMYLPGFGPSASSSSVQQPKLQTAFVSNTSSFSFPQSIAAPQPQFDPRSYIPVPTQPQPQPQVSTTKPQFEQSIDCGTDIQLGNDDQTRTAFYAEIVKNVNDGQSSEDDNSSGYSGSSDEESNLNERIDSEADELSNEVDKKSDLIEKADATSKEMEKILTEEGSFSSQTVSMTNVTASSSQVKVETPSICSECAKMKHECDELRRESETIHSHNQSLVIELSKCKEANMALTQNEKDFKSVIETLKKSVSELNKVVYHKQVSINDYINLVEETKKELAIAKCEHDAIKQKLESYSNSRFVLDHIIDVQQLKGNVKGVGYKACPPPLMDNYTKMPDEEEMPRYEPSVPLDVEEFATGLGFKPDNSSEGSSDNKGKSSCASNQSPPTIEDCDSSDDESDVNEQDKSLDETKGVEIPIENHILCDPPTPVVQPAVKQVIDPVKDVKNDKKSMSAVKRNDLLYTLIGDSKIYSDKDFPIKNVNQSLIDKVFEDSTNQFLGKKIPRVTVNQCNSISKAEIRKQFGKQKSPTKQQPIAFKGKQHQRAPKPKAKVETKGARYQKKSKDVKFVASKGTDKIETFENKSNTDFVQKVKILKRNSDNNYTQHTNGCDERASTSGSTGSTSASRTNSPKFGERRTCFKCGKSGHIIKDCTNSPKPNFVERTPSEQGHSQRRTVSPKHDKRTIKEQETKQRRKNVKVIEKALKPETVKRKPSLSQSLKPETVHNTHSGKQKQTWKPKTGKGSRGGVVLENYQEVEITFLDSQGQPKSMKAWVPLSN
ncbi:putative transcription factor interactor and regulator CCHC(Zn) family [Helianthus annuus]|uniref:Transcription factor interactor and regulator CCHC(Zn) family n=1 Tax=Helianthus annuus TaxID=4232 RepID=A0A9K3HSG9_HELAN|nr:putative transcription factor interactor and regulator CCHC(Zn) family [Helianthus annuus]